MLLMLAAVGIYAVVAYTVSLRTREIGVRLAVGATARRVVRTFVGESLAVASLGALVGWAIALVAAMLFAPGGRPDPVVFATVPAILLTVAAAACWIPARAASRLDPMAALRND
jgi:ABC-type antimicrobial peptide transport system permease subunit